MLCFGMRCARPALSLEPDASPALRIPMLLPEPDLRRTWLFGPGADATAHAAMLRSGADVLIVDLEDFTPPSRRDEARRGIADLIRRCRDAGSIAAVRINALDSDGPSDLAAAMPAHPDVIAYPMADSAAQMHALHTALDDWEAKLGITQGATEIVPVCETALGVVEVRSIAGGSPRIRSALLGAEDLVADLCAERQPDALELDHARRRFLLECRAARVEPIDAPYTFSDAEDAVRETRYARRLGYHSKALVRPEHALPLNRALTPSDDEVRRAMAILDAFEAARARGEDRALVDGLWAEVPTYRNACRLIERARRLNARVDGPLRADRMR
jgi:citrate lyase subunit beta/citryl-CoA lyase